jgi:hypothetical protein
VKPFDDPDHRRPQPVTLGGDPPDGECHFRYAAPLPCAYGRTLLTHPTASGDALDKRRSEADMAKLLEVWRGLREATPDDVEHRDITG